MQASTESNCPTVLLGPLLEAHGSVYLGLTEDTNHQVQRVQDEKYVHVTPTFYFLKRCVSTRKCDLKNLKM